MKPKIGQRVKFVSLDPSVPTDHGTITEVSPSGDRVMVKWDDCEEMTHNFGGASRVFLASVNKQPGEP